MGCAPGAAKSLPDISNDLGPFADELRVLVNPGRGAQVSATCWPWGTSLVHGVFSQTFVGAHSVAFGLYGCFAWGAPGVYWLP